MPRTREQYEEIRKERINHIKQVALNLFANQGYFETSIAKIAQQANISKGLMYNYFASKEELIKSIINTGIEEIYASFDRNHDGELTADEFEFFIREAFRVQQEKREFYKLYYSLLTQPKIQEMVEHEMGDLSKKVMEITYDYFKKRFDDPYTELLIYASLIKGLSMQYVYGAEHVSDDVLNKAINRIIEMYKK